MFQFRSKKEAKAQEIVKLFSQQCERFPKYFIHVAQLAFCWPQAILLSADISRTFMNEFYDFHNKFRFFSRSLPADFLHCSVNYCLRANTVQSDSMIRIESNGIFLLRFPIFFQKAKSTNFKVFIESKITSDPRDFPPIGINIGNSNICVASLGASTQIYKTRNKN